MGFEAFVGNWRLKIRDWRLRLIARKSDQQRNGTEEQDPHGGLESELVGEEADQKREKFCERRRDRSDGHDAGALTGQA